MTDREALERIAQIVRSGVPATTARRQVIDLINEVLGPPHSTPFSGST